VKDGLPILCANLDEHKRGEAIFHDRIANQMDSAHGLDSPRIDYLHQDFLRPIYNLTPDSKILEVACGTGSDALRLMRAGYEVAAFDISERLVRIAREKITKEGMLDHSFLFVADAERIPFPDDYFDVAFAVASLHHLENPYAGFKEMVRVVKPDGQIVLGSEPNRWPYYFRALKKSKIGTRILSLFRDDYTLSHGPPGDEKTMGFVHADFTEMGGRSGARVEDAHTMMYLLGFVQLLRLNLPPKLERVLMRTESYLAGTEGLRRLGWKWNVTFRKIRR